MPKQKKRHIADYSMDEMAQLCDMKINTFKNKFDKVTEKYCIDTDTFKYDPGAVSGEYYFPAGCSELLMILIKTWDANPSSRSQVNRDTNRDRVSVSSINSFYTRVLDEIEKLPPEIKGLVYLLNSYFATNQLILWSDRMVKTLSLFTETYMNERQENIGALLQEFTCKIDEFIYMLYVNQRALGNIERKNYISLYGVAPEPDYLDYENVMRSQNIGVDYGIAALIEWLMVNHFSNKEDLQFDMVDESQDVVVERQKVYNTIKNLYGSSEFEESTIGKYTSGANTWKPISERIKDGELYGKDAMIRYYEKEVAKRELDIMSLKQRIAALKSDDNIGIGFPNASEMNDINKSFLQYYEMNEGSGSAAHKKYADQYVGQMLWNFLTQEIN